MIATSFSPRTTTLLITNAAVFLTAAIFHVLRLVYQSPAVIGEADVPLWVSWVGAPLVAGLAWLNWRALPRRGMPELLKLLMAGAVIDGLVLLYSWYAGLEYWGLSGSAFLWFAAGDGVLLAFLWYLLGKK